MTRLFYFGDDQGKFFFLSPLAITSYEILRASQWAVKSPAFQKLRAVRGPGFYLSVLVQGDNFSIAETEILSIDLHAKSKLFACIDFFTHRPILK